ncbi:hypothetical protein [Winogradskyella immobilis]|uniref:PEGA domain-containing protein n=1 Tax=Winogradskyella immobilis TaxID=2816852 RepID=A0ABS8EKH2_9FLAO|nr:hypothetical protein [Winogradskyella immobilis]MCC1483729.1 hypothetical protein [Winogradskyella immobilis]MCG0015823.1 hypothetical protein [Winogradskyella immobilis]
MRILFTILAFITILNVSAQKTRITTSEPDAQILVNGEKVGNGSYTLKLSNKDCYNVRASKPGFLKYEVTLCGKKAGPQAPKTHFFDMQKDDSEIASIQTDQANVDFEIIVNPELSVDEAWKLVYLIVTDYFDAIEVSDKETSYLRTAWSVQSFLQNTIRTRMIIKLANSSPLTYKVKLNSEYSGSARTSVKADELYRAWDRVLRKYENVIGDFSTRLQKK